MFEVAKHICQSNGELSEAQVLMLDFANAYDSLDRKFMLAVLKAKGFPQKILRIIKATHENTSVRFLANGFLSETMEVTSGIRQGCPLAPLLFIIAVDILYDVIEGDSRLSGVPLSGHGQVPPLKIAGYADDTAIYLAHKELQSTAVHLVKKFSAISGLKLNVQNSTAIQLGRGAEHDPMVETSSKDLQSDSGEGGLEAIQVTNSARYLGHIAGSGDTVAEAWNKAFAALRVRLTLAEMKTNTALQRAEIAAAIVIPKLLYVARHAWPSLAIIKQADKAIRNFVWRSVFRTPERTPPGWVQANIAEQKDLKGGIGLPNIQTELMAMSAQVVGEWALTTKPQLQVLGEVLLERDGGGGQHITPTARHPRKGLSSSLRKTGRPWTEIYFHKTNVPNPETEADLSRLRAALRFSNGVSTAWTRDGLVISCAGHAMDLLREKKARRREQGGLCAVTAVEQVDLRHLWIGNAQGVSGKWSDYKELYPAIGGLTVGSIMRIEAEKDGRLRLLPTTLQLSLTSRHAHIFRETGLNLLTNFPELLGARMDEKLLVVQHPLEDPHRVFEVKKGDGVQIIHTWGSTTKKVEWQSISQRVEEALEAFLQVEKGTVSVAPHPALTRMRPLWVGNRRWTQSRRQYKALIRAEGDKLAEVARRRILDKLDGQQQRVAKALREVNWKQIHRMEGASAYLTQNLYKLKMNRLRVWAGQEHGLRCQAVGCEQTEETGTMHLIWTCPESQRFWTAWTDRWGWREKKAGRREAERVEDIFGLKLAAG